MKWLCKHQWAVVGHRREIIGGSEFEFSHYECLKCKARKITKLPVFVVQVEEQFP